MPSSKGTPTDASLREKVKNQVKKETNKDGSGKGQWSAWKAVKLSKEYEKKGGSYENEPGSKNEPSKGTPRAKSDEKKGSEMKEEKKRGEKKKNASETKGTAKKTDDADAVTQEEGVLSSGDEDKVKKFSGSEKKPVPKPTKKQTPKKAKKPQVQGTRTSSRIAKKRSAPDDDRQQDPKKLARS